MQPNELWTKLNEENIYISRKGEMFKIEIKNEEESADIMYLTENELMVLHKILSTLFTTPEIKESLR